MHPITLPVSCIRLCSSLALAAYWKAGAMTDLSIHFPPRQRRQRPSGRERMGPTQPVHLVTDPLSCRPDAHPQPQPHLTSPSPAFAFAFFTAVDITSHTHTHSLPVQFPPQSLNPYQPQPHHTHGQQVPEHNKSRPPPRPSPMTPSVHLPIPTL
ncbi:hypothetical protein EV126DRAFT_196900 [Verticillium dahliae]|nr:hypothetical protein EV126DRAFT_196900 [Verticillium dahliae]